MPTSTRQSTAKREGYKILGDQDLLNGVENRARQLEAELVGQTLFRDEAAAVGDESAVTAHEEEIGKLKTRLEVVHTRRDVLKSNMPKADQGGKTDPAPTT